MGRYAPTDKSHMPEVVRLLAAWGATAEPVHLGDELIELARIRVDYDLYVLKDKSDLAMRVAAALHAAEAALLNPYPASATLRDRIVKLRVLQAAGVPAPKTFVASHVDQLRAALEHGPLVIKPYRKLARSAPGEGIHVVRGAPPRGIHLRRNGAGAERRAAPIERPHPRAGRAGGPPAGGARAAAAGAPHALCRAGAPPPRRDVLAGDDRVRPYPPQRVDRAGAARLRAPAEHRADRRGVASGRAADAARCGLCDPAGAATRGGRGIQPPLLVGRLRPRSHLAPRPGDPQRDQDVRARRARGGLSAGGCGRRAHAHLGAPA